MLHHQRGNPNIVGRNGSSLAFKLKEKTRIMMGRLVVGEEHHRARGGIAPSSRLDRPSQYFSFLQRGYHLSIPVFFRRGDKHLALNRDPADQRQKARTAITVQLAQDVVDQKNASQLWYFTKP